MSFIIFSYIVYLVITILLTVWVAQTLFSNGKVFILDIFHGNEPLANSVNKLLLTGFYLINIGYAVYTLQISEPVQNWQDVFEKLSTRIGLIILILGGMHFFNLYVFYKMRKRVSSQKQAHIPVISADNPGIF
jgi:hypothetical protein